MDILNIIRNLVAQANHHVSELEELLDKLDKVDAPAYIQAIIDEFDLYELQGTVLKYNADLDDLTQKLKSEVSVEVPM